MKKLNIFCISIFSVLLLNINAKEIFIEPGLNAHERLQEAMILMQEGDILTIKSAYYSFEDGLSLDVDKVTVRGEGMEDTFIDIANYGMIGLLVGRDKWKK